ncbi:MAG: acyl carrier protein [Chloroflexi bacterium]|nr:acyl carrier protein [Chloroflexota bacterium]
MDKTELMAKLADVLQISVVDLTEDFAFNADNWDSTAQLSTIAIIDEAYSIVVPANELKECRTVCDLLSLVEHNLSAV